MSDEPRRPRRRRPRPETRRTQRHWTDYLPILALAAFVLAVVVVSVAALSWLAPAGNPVNVPAFIGMPFAQAETLAQSSHVGLRVVAHRTDFHAPKDVIIGQLPTAGEKVRENRVIDVILSDGVPMVTTPNLSNLSLRDARVALDNAKLTLGKVTDQLNTNVIAGQVLEQRPDPFTSLPAGSAVDVTIAKGRPQMYTPSFVGMSLDSVKAAAKEANIVLGAITQMPLAQNAKPKGIVVDQDPPAGQALAPKQKVLLDVSSGPPQTPTPSPSPQFSAVVEASPAPSPTPSSALPSPGAPRAMRVSVALPKSDVAKPVRVVLEDARGSRTLFEQTTTGGITLSFDLTVVGEGTIETYVDGKLVTTTPL